MSEKKLTKVAFVFVKKDNKVLLLQEGGFLAMGLWCFPGGHVEEGETVEQGAIRETLEETGYQITVEKVIYQSLISDVDYKGTVGDTDEVDLVIFMGKIVGGGMKRDDQALDLKWLTREEILLLPLRWNLLKDLI